MLVGFVEIHLFSAERGRPPFWQEHRVVSGATRLRRVVADDSIVQNIRFFSSGMYNNVASSRTKQSKHNATQSSSAYCSDMNA